ncbi:MAG: mutY [Burkholderiaceae bacterium]|nr:mutY [Burkholderiaceae bacterium]
MPVDFAVRLIRWQQRHGRHDLPWQNTRDAYRIWLSEIMLQQTQVATVIPYFEHFIERFPDVFSLAAAPQHEVMALWSGLGYYSRARNLHRCSQQVVADYHGVFPSDPALLAALPGIGRSTAAAVAVFSGSTRAAILDGNVRRVLCRAFGIDGYPGEKAVETTLWQKAESLLPQKNIEAYTQGLMDLGATVCTRSKPDCPACPLSAQCIALATGRVAKLPQRKPKKETPEKHVAMLLVLDGGQVLLQRRPEYGIWGGLWSLPEMEPGEQEAVVRKATAFGQIANCRPLSPFSHAFTHFRLRISPWLLQLKQRAISAAQHEMVWHELARLDEAPLPAPIRKLLQEFRPDRGDEPAPARAR